MSTSQAMRGVRPPAQKRSQETLDRILTATVGLLDGRSFSEISVLEICNAAEVSASSFYARFESKDRLLALLYRRHQEERRVEMDEAVEAMRALDIPVRDLITLVAAGYLDFHRRNRPLVQTLRLAEMENPALADDRMAVDRYSMGILCEELVRRIAPEGDSALLRRVDFASRSASVMLQDTTYPPFPYQDDARFDYDAIIPEVVDMWMLYVYGEASPAPEARGRIVAA